MSKRLLAAALVLTACQGEPTGPPAPPCTPGGSPSLTLSVGGVAVVSDPTSMACAQIPASPGATDYLFIVANAFPGAAGAAGYTVAAALTVAAAGEPVIPAPVVETPAPPGMPTRDVAMELRIRAAERRILNLAAASRHWAAAQSRVPSRPQGAVPAAPPAVGDSLSFRVPNPTATNLCTSYFTVRAVVKAVGTHGIIVQDTATPANGFTAADFASLSNEFDTFTYTTDVSYFGNPTDLDGNSHVYALYTPRVNAATKRGSSSYFAGFFFAGDLFPRTDCTESNVGEIFYLLVPDPTGRFSDPRPTTFVRQVTRAVIAHELEHMINLGVRLVESGTNPNVAEESIWLDEALAHFAEEYLGRAEDGLAPFQRLTYADVSANANDYNAFYRNNLANLGAWLARPDTTSSIANTDKNLADGGAAWALLHYTADQYAGSNLAAFTVKLVAGPDSGLRNLTSTAGAPFDSLMAGWMLAMYADGLGIPGLNSRYTFLSWNYRDAETRGGVLAYPLWVTALTSGSSVATQARPGSGNYFRRTSSPSTPDEVFRVLSRTGGLVTFPGARLYVLRAQ